MTRGAMYTFGVDFGVRRLAFGVVAEGEEPVMRDLRWSSPSGPGALSELYRQAYLAADRYLAEWPAREVWVEQPFARPGKGFNPVVLHAEGIVLAAVYGVLRQHGSAARIESVGQSAWKRSACGFGDASKQDVLAWASRMMGAPVTVEDCADGLGVAVHGHAQCFPEGTVLGRARGARVEATLL